MAGNADRLIMRLGAMDCMVRAEDRPEYEKNGYTYVGPYSSTPTYVHEDPVEGQPNPPKSKAAKAAAPSEG